MGNDPQQASRPPWQAYAQNPLGVFLGSLGAARQNQDYQDRIAQIVELGAQRFEAIGTPEAQQSAQLLRQNPTGFYSSMEQFGGMAKLEDRLRDRAQQQRVSAILAAATPDTTERELMLSLASTVGAEKAAKIADDFVKSGMPEERRVFTDVIGYKRYEGGEYLFPDTKGKAIGKITLSQRRANEEIDRAREYVADWMNERGKTKHEMRTIVGRGDEMFAALEDQSEDPLTARMFRTAFKAKTGGDAGRDAFLDRVIGLEGKKVPRDANGYVVAEDLQPGMIYNVNGQRLRWNPTTRMFEDLR